MNDQDALFDARLAGRAEAFTEMEERPTPAPSALCVECGEELADEPRIHTACIVTGWNYEKGPQHAAPSALREAAQKVETAYLNNLGRDYPADLFIALDELRDALSDRGCERPSDPLSVGLDWCVVHNGRWRLDRPHCGASTLAEPAAPSPETANPNLVLVANGKGGFRRVYHDAERPTPAPPSLDWDRLAHAINAAGIKVGTPLPIYSDMPRVMAAIRAAYEALAEPAAPSSLDRERLARAAEIVARDHPLEVGGYGVWCGHERIYGQPKPICHTYFEGFTPPRCKADPQYGWVDETLSEHLLRFLLAAGEREAAAGDTGEEER